MKYMFLLFNEESDKPPTPEEMAPWQAFGEEASKVASPPSRSWHPANGHRYEP